MKSLKDPGEGPGEEPGEDRLRQNAESNLVVNQMNQVKVYQRNFDTCVRAAQRNEDPAHRSRHDVPEVPTTQHPSVVEFGELTHEMAQTMRTWSHSLEDLGQLLIRAGFGMTKNKLKYRNLPE